MHSVANLLPYTSSGVLKEALNQGLAKLSDLLERVPAVVVLWYHGEYDDILVFLGSPVIPSLGDGKRKVGRDQCVVWSCSDVKCPRRAHALRILYVELYESFAFHFNLVIHSTLHAWVVMEDVCQMPEGVINCTKVLAYALHDMVMERCAGALYSESMRPCGPRSWSASSRPAITTGARRKNPSTLRGGDFFFFKLKLHSTLSSILMHIIRAAHLTYALTWHSTIPRWRGARRPRLGTRRMGGRARPIARWS